jgi:hypothetical protein
MTDLEMTKLCAEAIGLVPAEGEFRDRDIWGQKTELSPGVYMTRYLPYDPLNDGVQAMTLLERFNLSVTWFTSGDAEVTHYAPPQDIADVRTEGPLKRAIVECVAKMQAATLTSTYPSAPAPTSENSARSDPSSPL